MTRPWLLLGLTALGFVFLSLVYHEFASLSERMRWQRGFLAAGGLRTVFNSTIFLMLAFGSFIGPAAFASRVLKRKVQRSSRQKKEPIQPPQTTTGSSAADRV